MEGLKQLKNGMAPGPSEFYAEMTLASGSVEIAVLMELSQRILDGKVLPALSVAITIYGGKLDITNCGMFMDV